MKKKNTLEPNLPSLTGTHSSNVNIALFLDVSDD